LANRRTVRITLVGETMSLLTTVKGVKRGGSNTLSLLWLAPVTKAAVAATRKIEPPIAHRLRVFEGLGT
jgi:hypothetical protein